VLRNSCGLGDEFTLGELRSDFSLSAISVIGIVKKYVFDQNCSHVSEKSQFTHGHIQALKRIGTHYTELEGSMCPEWVSVYSV